MAFDDFTPQQQYEIGLKHIVQGKTAKELAEEYNTTPQRIAKLCRSQKVLGMLERHVKREVQKAQICLYGSALMAARGLVRDAEKERDDKTEYLGQQARREILDRTGVRAPKVADETITITFAGGGAPIVPGMPVSSERKTEPEPDNSEEESE